MFNPPESEVTDLPPSLYVSEDGTLINEAGFELGWRDGEEPFVVEGYGIALWGKNPGEPPQGQDEVLRVLKQLGCTIFEDRHHVYDEDDDPDVRGRQCRALEVRLPVNMTEKQGKRFRSALDRWDQEFEANIDTGDVT